MAMMGDVLCVSAVQTADQAGGGENSCRGSGKRKIRVKVVPLPFSLSTQIAPLLEAKP